VPGRDSSSGLRHYVDVAGLLEAVPVLSRWTLYERTRTGTFPHRQLGRKLLFDLDEVYEFLDGQRDLETLTTADGGRVVRIRQTGRR
jgi:hypothetical protein